MEPQQDRPGSRLKQNIDDLDSLLYDLNNVRKVSDGGGDYTASSCVTPGNVSDDYSYHEGTQGHVKRTAQTYNDQSYQVTSASSPPSARRNVQPQQKQTIDQSSSYKYSSSSAYASSAGQEQKQEQQTRSYAVSSAYPPPPAEPDRRPTLPPSQPLPSPDGTPAGVTYYSKYHSAQSHTSQGKGPSSFPASSPASTAPRQTPPKRVDHLLSELSEFDSSIKDTRFDEPKPRSPERAPYRPESPVRQVKTDSGPQQSTPGPAVYYPPGDMFGSNKKPDASAPAKPKDKGKNKGKISDPGEGKQGAAVVPICLPLCCAAPCVIM